MDEEAVRIGTLKVGERFALIDRSFQITGTIKHQAKGYTSVRIDGGDKIVTIGDREFEARGTSSSEWSPTVEVFRINDKPEQEESNVDSVPIDAGALNGAGEPIPLPRPVPTPASFSPKKEAKEKTDVATKGKIKDDKKAQARIALANIRNKEKAKVAKAVAGPSSPKSKVVVKCRCGCGGETRSMFSPGHDARFYGWAKKIAAGESFDKLKNFTAAGKAELATPAKAKAVLAASGH